MCTPLQSCGREWQSSPSAGWQMSLPQTKFQQAEVSNDPQPALHDSVPAPGPRLRHVWPSRCGPHRTPPGPLLPQQTGSPHPRSSAARLMLSTAPVTVTPSRLDAATAPSRMSALTSRWGDRRIDPEKARRHPGDGGRGHRGAAAADGQARIAVHGQVGADDVLPGGSQVHGRVGVTQEGRKAAGAFDGGDGDDVVAVQRRRVNRRDVGVAPAIACGRHEADAGRAVGLDGVVRGADLVRGTGAAGGAGAAAVRRRR